MYNGLIKDIIVIGGNAAGLAVASQARRLDEKVNITVLESGKYVSYGSCSLAYYVSGDIKGFDDLFAYPKDFFETRRNIKILTLHRATGIDTVGKKVFAQSPEDNSISFDYDRLAICSGATNIVPDIKGLDADNMFMFRDVEDTLKLMGHIKNNPPEKALIIGGGYIGLLIAESLIKLGIKVTVVELFEHIFGDFETEISTILYKKATLSGANILTSSRVTEIVKEGRTAKSAKISTPDGDLELDLDMGIISTGIKANTSFLVSNGRCPVELGQKEAIKVSPKQQTSHLNIFAAGDCCLCRNIVTGKYDYLPTANNAVKMGRIAGENMVGGNLDFEGSVGTRVDRVFDIELARTGIGLDEASELGIDAIKVSGTYPSHVRSLPGAKDITISIIFENRTGRLLGAQMIGANGVAKRIDVFAAALTNEMDVEGIYMLDLSYTPKVSTVWDPVNKICAKATLNLKDRRF